MKAKIFAYITLFTIIASVFANTHYINQEIGEIAEAIQKIDTSNAHALNNVKTIQERFVRSSLFISLTVSHDDLTNVENDFAELIGCLTVGETNEATVVKSRLLNSLEHLRRLSDINFDAII